MVCPCGDGGAVVARSLVHLQESVHKFMLYSLLTFTAEQICTAKNPASPKPNPKQPCQLGAAPATSAWADGSNLWKWIKQQVEV